MDSNCTHALVRLQVCPGCGGVSLKGAEVKPCRALCLNVMRGCLAKILGISSSWDDLVVEFENLEIGMMGQHELQKMLMYLDTNVSTAIMTAMEDSARIYDEVKIKCQSIPHTDDSATPLRAPTAFSSSAAGELDVPSGRVDTLQNFHAEMKSLVKYLDDSKGMFNRLADDLCQSDKEYDQVMHSDRCWNGTHVGRYMASVPEANFMSQVQHNKEVLISLLDRDFKFLVVRDDLIHMRKNLSNLLNSDVMLGDHPYTPAYKNVAASLQEGSGQKPGYPEVIIDDEDLAGYGSASGSGSGDDQTEETPVEKPVVTKAPTKPTRPPPLPGSASTTVMPVVTFIVLCVLHHRLWRIMQ